MKVVLFCGGLGTRLREYSETIPKPLAQIGARPIIWHLMKYYAHFGHTDFILCLGHGADLIRAFIGQPDAYPRAWTVRLIDTGLQATIADRLLAARTLVGDDDVFLANYSDGLTDLALPTYLDRFDRRPEAVAGFLSVRIAQSYHVVTSDAAGAVTAITRAGAADVWINGGFFVFRQAIFDHIDPGDELVEAPFHRLMARGLLFSHRHDGFWAAVDTYKDKVALDRLCERGDAPWEVWRRA